MNPMLFVLLILAGVVLLIIAKTAIVVPQQSAFVVERLGRYSATISAGFHVLVPFVDAIRCKHSLKEMAVDIPAQVCITRDNVRSASTAWLYLKVLNPERASYGISDYMFDGGFEAVQLRVAEQYITQFGELAKKATPSFCPPTSPMSGR